MGRGGRLHARHVRVASLDGEPATGPPAIDVVADPVIEIRLGPLVGEGDACTADMSGYVTVVDLPVSRPQSHWRHASTTTRSRSRP